MKSRPWPIIVVALIFMIAGCAGFIYHFNDMFASGKEALDARWVEALRLAAIVCAILLWMGINWGRWLAIAWIAFHVIISFYHSISEVVSHIIILALITVLLYLPKSTAFFKSKMITSGTPPK